MDGVCIFIEEGDFEIFLEVVFEFVIVCGFNFSKWVNGVRVWMSLEGWLLSGMVGLGFFLLVNSDFFLEIFFYFWWNLM